MSQSDRRTEDKNNLDMVHRKEENHATSSICPWFLANAAQLMANFGAITPWIWIEGYLCWWISGQGNWQDGGLEYGHGRKQTKWQTMKWKRWWGSWQANCWTRYWIRHTHTSHSLWRVARDLRDWTIEASPNQLLCQWKMPVLIDFLQYQQVRLRLSEDSFHPLGLTGQIWLRIWIC